MFGFSNGKKEAVLLLDIGSASVVVSIVTIDTKTKVLERVWSHTESNLVRNTDTQNDGVRGIQTILTNAMLVLGNTGMKKLRAHTKSLSITSVQVAISAPWVYTATQTISFERDKPFEVTGALLAQLSASAQKKITGAAVHDQTLKTLDMQQVHNTTTCVTINGYVVNTPEGKEGKTLKLTHLRTVAQQKLLQTIEESVQKILPTVTLEHQYASMYLLYRASRILQPHIMETCLIQVRGEATEIGIVRDGILCHVSYIPFGSYTLARNIAKLYKVPTEEAYGYLADAQTIPIANNDETQSAFESILASYEEKIGEGLQYTGDALLIPRTILLDATAPIAIESFFAQRIKNTIAKIRPGSCVVRTLLDAQTFPSGSAQTISEYFLQIRVRGIR